MPAVICDQDHVTHWRNTRGSGQPKVCPKCNRPVKRALFDGDRYVQPPKRVKVKTVIVVCAICGQGRKWPSPNARHVTEDREYVKGWSSVKVKAGDYVCWHHIPLEVGEEWAGTGGAGVGEFEGGGDQ